MPPPQSHSSSRKPSFTLRAIAKPKGLQSLVTSNNIVILVMSNGDLLRVNNADGSTRTIRLSKSRRDGPPLGRVHKAFIDPSGRHILVSLQTGENWYLNSTMGSPMVLAKFKGVLESVAWDQTNKSETTTKEILLGSRNGRIYEALIDQGKERYFKLLFDMRVRSPITGLHMEKYRLSKDSGNRCAIMATTPTRFYTFVGGPTLEAVFQQYDADYGYQEITPPNGTLSHSKLAIRSAGAKKASIHFAWLTGAGLFHGKFALSKEKGLFTISDTRLLPYIPSKRDGVVHIPLSIAMSKYHFFFLYEDAFVAISRINNEVVDSQRVSSGTIRLLGVESDAAHDRCYVYGTTCVFQLEMSHESIDAWRLYLETRQYDAALKHCSTAAQKEKVYAARAKHLLADGKVVEAAKEYGRTTAVPFEEVALLFIAPQHQWALTHYLQAKLSQTLPREATQKTLLCTWLTETYCHLINTSESERTQRKARKKLRLLLDTQKDHLDKQTTYTLLRDQGLQRELLHYTSVLKEFDEVIHCFMQQDLYENAVETLSKHGTHDMFYKYSGELLQRVPELTLHAWSRVPELQVRRILPALMRLANSVTTYDEDDEEEEDEEDYGALVIHFLQNCVQQGCTDAVVHNALLSLLARGLKEEPLLEFLRTRTSHYDPRYALRICLQHDKMRAVVEIYSSMELFDSAVDAALKVDLDMAIENADKAEDDEMRKSLWLRIAKHVIQVESDGKKAMEFVLQCDLLRVEDVLPLFPDDVRIAEFKDEVRMSLHQYNENIQDLKQELSDATHAAEVIRSATDELKCTYVTMEPFAVCALCDTPAADRYFFLHRCGHAFHWDCLIREQQHTLSQREKRTLQSLWDKLRSALQNRKRGKDLSPQADACREELIEMIASECIYCGSGMVEAVDEPFVGVADEAAVRDWAL